MSMPKLRMGWSRLGDHELADGLPVFIATNINGSNPMGLAQTRDRDDGTMKGLCMGSGHGSIAIIVDSALGNSSYRGFFASNTSCRRNVGNWL